MGQELVCAAIQGGSLVGEVDFDPDTPTTTLQLGCPEGTISKATLTVGADLIPGNPYPLTPQSIALQSCLKGVPTQFFLTPALPL